MLPRTVFQILVGLVTLGLNLQVPECCSDRFPRDLDHAIPEL